MFENNHRLVKIDHDPNVSFKYGVVYLLGSQFKAVLDDTSNPSAGLLAELKRDYDVCVDIIDSRSLLTGFADDLLEMLHPGENCIFRLCLPYCESDAYFVAEVNPELVGLQVPEMIFEANELVEDYSIDVFKSLLINGYLDIRSLNERSLGESIRDIPSIFRPLLSWGPAFKSMASMTEEADYVPCVTFDDKIDAIQETLARIHKEGNTLEYSSRLECLLREFSHQKIVQLLKEYMFSSTEQKNAEVFETCFNKNRSGLESDVVVEIADYKIMHPRRTNDGIYRIKLYQKSNRDVKYLHFMHKPSCIIFMMHIIDRKLHKTATQPMDVRLKKEFFCDLYIMAYCKGYARENAYDEASAAFGRIAPSLDNKAARDESLYGRCYKDIRKAVRENFPPGKRCEAYILDEVDYLGIQDENITVPEELIRLGERYLQYG